MCEDPQTCLATFGQAFQQYEEEVEHGTHGHRAEAPVFLNRAETLRDAVGAVAEAAKGGARLVVFLEAFIPGYPA